jgi:hypothetical protein
MKLTLEALDELTKRYIKGANDYATNPDSDDEDVANAQGQDLALNAIRLAFGLPVINNLIA